MKSPLHQALWVLIGAGAAAIPLTALTSKTPMPSVQHNPPQQAHGLVSCLLSVKAAHPFKLLTITCRGNVILSSHAPADNLTMEQDVKLPISHGDPLELIVNAAWDEAILHGADTPITITITPETLPEQTVTKWSVRHTMLNVFSFTW